METLIKHANGQWELTKTTSKTIQRTPTLTPPKTIHPTEQKRQNFESHLKEASGDPTAFVRHAKVDASGITDHPSPTGSFHYGASPKSTKHAQVVHGLVDIYLKNHHVTEEMDAGEEGHDIYGAGDHRDPSENN